MRALSNYRSHSFQSPGRTEVLGTCMMVSTPHSLASAIGFDILRQGGNAVDAAVAAVAALGVVDPSQTGIGGDCFALYLPAGRQVPIALNGSGTAPAAADRDGYAARNGEAIRMTSADAVTVPGALRAWERLVIDHGRFEFSRLLKPAIGLAEEGAPVTERVAHDWRVNRDKLAADPGSCRLLLEDGKAPHFGARFRQPQLAKTLRAVAAGGASVFYEGEIAEANVRHLRALGGVHSADDFAAFRPNYDEPITARYRGYDVWQCPPNGTGIVPLIMARALEGYDMSASPVLSARSVHRMVEVGRQAFAARGAVIADPRFAHVPVDELLSEEFARRLRAAVDEDRHTPGLSMPDLPARGDTVFLAVVDRDGNAVALINSLFEEFGSGITVPQTGVLMQNRACGFSLAEGHPNVIEPAKRPLHTILPALLTLEGRAVMPFGVTGGPFQPFGQIALLTALLDHDMRLQQAIDLPRYFAWNGEIQIEERFDPAIADALGRLGHKVVPAPYALGCAQAIWIDAASGTLSGAADFRRDGCAIGL